MVWLSCNKKCELKKISYQAAQLAFEYKIQQVGMFEIEYTLEEFSFQQNRCRSLRFRIVDN